MGRRCCISGCQSTSRLPEHQGVTYHTFPLDHAIRSVWLKNTRLSPDRQITKSVLVCSRHFRRADFNPMKNGKYLLKHRVFPTVFPWGKIDPVQVEADQELLKRTAGQAAVVPTPENSEDATKATVAATVAQILAETAELNAAAGLKSPVLLQPTIETSSEVEVSTTMPTTVPAAVSPSAIKFEAVSSFSSGVRLEAQDFDGVWHAARVVEVDNDDREVLIRFERSGKIKTPVDGTEEWIPMNSNRLRQKVPNKPIPQFELDEKCMARWTGPRRFPGTVKKVLGNDTYEVLFDDGYVKNVRAIHMSKILNIEGDLAAIAALSTPAISAIAEAASSLTPSSLATMPSAVFAGTSPKATASPTELATGSAPTTNKKRSVTSMRKDWPLLDLSKLDLSTLNLPDIPHDGEWTCHWVNDQPIGKEGFLIVGEHRKPTVIVEDWRLPTGWIKHMYQRSNVLGKWDVILVSPNGKRFRSKSDLKIYLEEKGQVYNPDIYDFSIHRRRAKDINAYVFTPDYTPQVPKPKQLDTSLDISPDEKSALATSLETAVLTNTSAHYMETPIATATPPMELMTSPTNEKETPVTDNIANTAPAVVSASSTGTADVEDTPSPAVTAVGDGYAYIGGLKVQIVDNLFRCPEEGCSKNFRKENHVQIHIKHYHRHLAKLLGSCPKMLELAEKRTHTILPEASEPTPKNQIPNQQFFAKLHQQDLEHSRSHRRNLTQKSETETKQAAGTATETAEPILSPLLASTPVNKTQDATKLTPLPADATNISLADSPMLDKSLDTATTADDSMVIAASAVKTPTLSNKSSRSRFIPHHRRTFGSRRSNRQRTTRRFLTAAQASFTTTPTALPITTKTTPTSNADSSFGVTDLEETRHSFNGTPEIKKRKAPNSSSSAAAPLTPLSCIDSPITADSGSSSLHHLQAPSSNEQNDLSHALTPQVKYIQENGELIKIVRMRQTEIINCLCGYGEEDGLMIQCELCFCWQHGACNGIDKASEVPEKYVCFICRNPPRGRESMRFRHDQEWLYDGKLPAANYHRQNPNLSKRFEFLKRTHTVTGNLLAIKNFMHSLRVKINIANNRCHPKLYLWAKQWDEDSVKVEKHKQTAANDEKLDIKVEGAEGSPSKRPKLDEQLLPNIPQPEAPIDPEECQHRLHNHIKVQQDLVWSRLNDIESQVDALENEDDLPDLKDADVHTTKELLSTFIRELDVMRQIAKLNNLEHTKKAMKQQQQQQLLV